MKFRRHCLVIPNSSTAVTFVSVVLVTLGWFSRMRGVKHAYMHHTNKLKEEHTCHLKFLLSFDFLHQFVRFR